MNMLFIDRYKVAVQTCPDAKSKEQKRKKVSGG